MSEERKYEPTPRKRLETLRQGRFAYSPELVSAAVLLFGLIALTIISASSAESIKQTLLDSFRFQPSDLTAPTPETLGVSFRTVLFSWLIITLPFWILILGAAVIAHFAQRRFLFAPERELIDTKNVNPAEGFARIFSLANFWRTVLGIIKISLLTLLIYSFCRSEINEIVSLNAAPLERSAGEMGAILRNLAFRIAAALIVLGVCDYAWQYWKFERSIRMTEQEMRDELKNQ